MNSPRGKEFFFLWCHDDTSPRSLTTPPVSIAWGTTERPLNHQGGNLAKNPEIYTQQVYTSCNLERTLWRHKGHQHLTDTSLPRARCCWKSLTSRKLVLHHSRAASEFCMNERYSRCSPLNVRHDAWCKVVDSKRSLARWYIPATSQWSTNLQTAFSSYYLYVLQLSGSTGAVLQLSRLYRVFSGFKEATRVQSEDKRLSTERLLIQRQLPENLWNTF